MVNQLPDSPEKDQNSILDFNEDSVLDNKENEVEITESAMFKSKNYN